MRKAFTMVELIFVIVIIGILASVAVPRFTATRDDAIITSAKSTIAAVKSSLATERQLRILRGDFKAITLLNTSGGAFSTFSADSTGKKNSVLESKVPTCSESDSKTGCWRDSLNYVMPDRTTVGFQLINGRFECKSPTSAGCKQLTQ